MRTNELSETTASNAPSETATDYYSNLKKFLLHKETSDQASATPKEFSTAREAAIELVKLVEEAGRLPVTGMLLVEEKVLTRIASELERLTAE